jgi:hypothetical protein
MGIKWIEDQLNAEARAISQRDGVSLDEAARRMMEPQSQPIMLSMWSPESGQTWGDTGNENHGTITLADFLEANEEDEWVKEQVLALKPGDMVSFGGGASPYCEVTRLCDCGGFTRDARGDCAGKHADACPESRRLDDQTRAAVERANIELERFRRRWQR